MVTARLEFEKAHVGVNCCLYKAEILCKSMGEVLGSIDDLVVQSEELLCAIRCPAIGTLVLLAAQGKSLDCCKEA